MSVAVTVGVGAVVLMATELLPANDAMKGLLAIAFWGWVGGLIVWYRTV